MNKEIQINSITEDFIKSYFNKTLEFELIESVIYFLCVYPFLTIADYTITKNDTMIYLNFIMIVPILLMTYLRVKAKKMRTFAFGILGITILFSIIIVFVLKQYVLLAFLWPWAIISIKKSITMQQISIDMSKLLLIEGLLIPQIILGAYVGAKDIQTIVFIVPIIVMLLSMGYICKVRNLRLSMDDIKNHSFNKKDSNIFIAGLVIFIAILIFMLYYLGAFEIAHNYTKKIVDFFTNIGGGSIKNETNLPQHSSSNSERENLKKLAENGPMDINSPLFQIISKVLNTLFNIALVIAALIAIYVIINRILIYVKNLKNMDKVTFIYKDSKNTKNETKMNFFKLKQNINKALFSNNKEKIRKIYKNKIIKYKKFSVNINNYLSTSEIEKEILNKTNENIKEVTRVYEKARYSNDEITMQDLEILKNR